MSFGVNSTTMWIIQKRYHLEFPDELKLCRENYSKAQFRFVAKLKFSS